MICMYMIYKFLFRNSQSENVIAVDLKYQVVCQENLVPLEIESSATFVRLITYTNNFLLIDNFFSNVDDNVIKKRKKSKTTSKSKDEKQENEIKTNHGIATNSQTKNGEDVDSQFEKKDQFGVDNNNVCITRVHE